MFFINELFYGVRQTDIKVHMGKQLYQNNQEKKKLREELWGCLALANIKTYYEASRIKPVWKGHMCRLIGQWSRRERTEIVVTTYGNLVCNEGGVSEHWSNEGLLNKWCYNKWAAIWKKIKLDPYFTPCIRINSKQIRDLNVKIGNCTRTRRKCVNSTLIVVQRKPSNCDSKSKSSRRKDWYILL